MNIFKKLFFLFDYRKVRTQNLDKLKGSSAIVGVPFGSHKEGQKIGASNLAISQIMAKLHKKFPHQGLVAQWEMGESNLGLRFHYLSGKKYVDHINTHEFFENLRKVFPELINITVVGHPDHALRSKLTAEKLGFQVVLPEEIRRIPYDRQSSQKWCRSRLIFMPWEVLSRIVFVLKGWV